MLGADTSVSVGAGGRAEGFVAVDVETANSDLSSICQVGVASFRNGKAHDLWGSLVNPEDVFDAINVSIHGINERAVRGSPTWPAIYPKVRSLLRAAVVVCHTGFDRLAVRRACERYSLPTCECRWLDSARVVRRTWPIFSHSGYGLANVALKLGIQYRQHDAVEDARCAGEVLLRAIAETGLSIHQWLERVEQPMRPAARGASKASPEGPLYGEVLVFTGSLSVPRSEAADAVSAAGCQVDAGVTRRTTLLVVGDQDVRRLAGHTKSSKHRKAESLIAKGQKIRIISEGDVRRLLKR